MGASGERALAFAYLKLDPQTYPKSPLYPFDTADWKRWNDVKERDESIPGWFPIHNLTFAGLVSLNDPPRPQVPSSILKCR